MTVLPPPAFGPFKLNQWKMCFLAGKVKSAASLIFFGWKHPTSVIRKNWSGRPSGAQNWLRIWSEPQIGSKSADPETKKGFSGWLREDVRQIYDILKTHQKLLPSVFSTKRSILIGRPNSTAGRVTLHKPWLNLFWKSQNIVDLGTDVDSNSCRPKRWR